MKKSAAPVAILLALCLAIPAFAGSGEKCSVDAQTCLNFMATKVKTSGWLGIEYDKVGGTSDAMKVANVVPGSPAEKAGFQVGDVILALNGIRYGKGNEEAIKKAKAGMTPGAAVTYLVQRGGTETEIAATLAAWPPDAASKWIGTHMLEDHALLAAAEKAEDAEKPEKEMKTTKAEATGK